MQLQEGHCNGWTAGQVATGGTTDQLLTNVVRKVQGVQLFQDIIGLN